MRTGVGVRHRNTDIEKMKMLLTRIRHWLVERSPAGTGNPALEAARRAALFHP
jgi:hypothetical protein